MANNLASNMSALAAAAQAAIAGGNNSLASQLMGMFHQTPTNVGLNFHDKTMTTTWYSSNSAQATTLVAMGWTIIPG